jgi:hypothetical protein
MKKLLIIPLIAFVAFTVLNVSKIDTKHSLKESLSSIISSAKADSEDPQPCFYQNIYDCGLQYTDECNWMQQYYWQCWNGFEELCKEGSYSHHMSFCTYWEDEYYIWRYCLGK